MSIKQLLDTIRLPIMRRSPLILDYYFVKKVQFELKAGFDENFERDVENDKAPNFKVNVKPAQHSDDSLSWRFELNIEADEKASDEDFPYTFGVTVVGYFRVDEKYPSEDAEILATVNAPSVLYSAAREFLASVTGRSPYSAILLPSVSFVPLPEEQKDKEEKTIPKPQKSVKKEKSTEKKSTKKST